MPRYLVEALSQHRIVYVVDTEKKEYAEEAVWAQEVEELGQMHLGEIVVSSREIDDVEALRMFHEMNDYLSGWAPEQKTDFINRHAKVKVRDEQ
jgi:hypothetical protein